MNYDETGSKIIIFAAFDHGIIHRDLDYISMDYCTLLKGIQDKNSVA